METNSKVTRDHLKRTAYLYLRQSTVRQVFENTESTKRQYALRQRAIALGWPEERIEVIDTDLGQSATSAVDRQGFQKLVAEVGLGWAGVVMGLEVSRLARNSTDWHRLIEICALTDTLILDEDGLYDPAEFNDRLLLGLKGTMSEAEIHLLMARLRGGLINKARRGELRGRLPLPLNAWQGRKTSDYVLAQIDDLLKHHTDRQVAVQLNERGLTTGAGGRFCSASVRWIRYATGMNSYKERLREAGMLTTQEIAVQLGVSESTVKLWYKEGLLQGRKCNDKGDWLYHPPGNNPLMQKLRERQSLRQPGVYGIVETTAGGVV